MRLEKARHTARARLGRLLLAGPLAAVICAAGSYGQSRDSSGEQGAARESSPRMPSIAPIGVRVDKYMEGLPPGPRPEWSSKLAGFDVYVCDQCYAMEQSRRVE